MNGYGCQVTFHFHRCEQVTNPQKPLQILSSKTCIRVKILPFLSCLPPPCHANSYLCGGDQGLVWIHHPQLEAPWVQSAGEPAPGGQRCLWLEKVCSLMQEREEFVWDKCYGLRGRLRVSGRGQEKKKYEAQMMEKPTLCRLKQQGWWSSKEPARLPAHLPACSPACLPAQPWALSSLVLGCYTVLS